MRSLLLLIALTLAACPQPESDDDTLDDDDSVTDDDDSVIDDDDVQDDDDSGDCEPEFPALPELDDDDSAMDDDDCGDDDDSAPPPELDTTGLVAHWPLDGDWDDAWGSNHLVPFRAGGFEAADVPRPGGNLAYGPTGEAADNGAQRIELTSLDTSAGATLEGWYWAQGNNGNATLFGFGDGGYDPPSLSVRIDWGHPKITTGQASSHVTTLYPRPDPGCWHHLALVLPVGFEGGVPFQLYVDGVEQTPDTGDAVAPAEGLFGEPFMVGIFGGAQGPDSRVDEVRLWERALTAEELAVAATPLGAGEQCPGVPIDWEPGPRCTFPEEPEPLLVPQVSEVRVLTDDVVVLMSDPTAWLYDKVDEHCGTYLAAMDENADQVESWWSYLNYKYAWLETRAHYWPRYLQAWAEPEQLLVAGCGPGEEAQAPAHAVHWPQPIREVWLPHGSDGGFEHLYEPELLWVAYLELPFPLRDGEPYAVRDGWGNRVDFRYELDETISWALKVDQLGYLPDAPKYGYLGGWLAHEGPLDVSGFDGASFDVVVEGTGEVAFTGAVAFRMDDVAVSGEMVYELDFTELQTPGEYHLRLPGAGRSWTFTIGQDALGEAFYVHARGLLHNRCGMDLGPPVTPWARGDIHQTWRAAFPPYWEDYGDHAAEGWGFQDEAGAYVQYDQFDVAALTATDELLPDVNGGWHDAGDYDRRPWHFGAVRDLLVSWLMYPDNFTDGQLHLPESDNGIPDVIDEARWGVDVWLASQEADGAVATWIEATSHPTEADPGLDEQPYYLALPTRTSSLDYAEAAALLGWTLQQAGFPDEAATYVDSALAAWAFGTDPAVRVSTSFVAGDGTTHTWTEAPEPDALKRMWAAVALRLATGDDGWDAELETHSDLLLGEVNQLWWKEEFFRVVPVALEPDSFPDGWGAAATDALVAGAEMWMGFQPTHAYRRVWYEPDHGYYFMGGWGNNLHRVLRPLVAAWRVTGDTAYRDAAALGVNHLQGANGQGRVGTTGLGEHHAQPVLHLPSWSDDVQESVPGLTLFGNPVGVPWTARTTVWGSFADPRDNPPFDGVELILLPPPFDNEAYDFDGLTDLLYEMLPYWRRVVPMESTNVAIMEFTVDSTISPAAAVTGCLMGPGWMPPAGFPRSPENSEQVRSSRWMLP